jgi:hypothetical protein
MTGMAENRHGLPSLPVSIYTYLDQVFWVILFFDGTTNSTGEEKEEKAGVVSVLISLKNLYFSVVFSGLAVFVCLGLWE